MVSGDAKWELLILEVVHGFDIELLRKLMEDEVPLPPGLDTDSLRQPVAIDKTLAGMRRWLKLLDLAITPALVREALAANVDQDLAEALLRYYVQKKSHTTFDRDKTDFIATFLYRNPRVAGQWETRGYSMDGMAPLPPFEIALLEILGDSDLPELSPDNARMLDELTYMSDAVDDIRDFDELIDSGMIQKARDIKHSLGPALYHPHALALLAPYNALFGSKFSELFAAATAHIKNFAEEVQLKGGSIQALVDGDVTVKQLTELKGEEVLNTEYFRAQDRLRHVSKLKKAVDSSKAGQKRAQGASASTGTVRQNPAVSPGPGKAGGPGEIVPAHDAAPGPPPLAFEEDSRLRSVQESIRSFVRAADPKFRQVVPMRFGNFVLSPAEADAYCAAYVQETSFRGDSARAFMRMVAISARMTGEMQELQQKQSSTYLWRPHAEALQFLLVARDQVTEDTNRLLELATQRGLVERVTALNASLQKLRLKSEEATGLLAMMATAR